MDPVTITLIAIPILGAIATAWYNNSKSKKMKKFLKIIIDATNATSVNKSTVIKSVVKNAMEKRGVEEDFKKIVHSVESDNAKV